MRNRTNSTRASYWSEWEERHRALIEDLRTGLTIGEMAAAAKAEAGGGGIQVQLLNPGSWLSGGNVSLDLRVLRRADRRPEGGASVEASIEGALQEGVMRRRATTKVG